MTFLFLNNESTTILATNGVPNICNKAKLYFATLPFFRLKGKFVKVRVSKKKGLDVVLREMCKKIATAGSKTISKK